MGQIGHFLIVILNTCDIKHMGSGALGKEPF
jgi:hypothetical protein